MTVTPALSARAIVGVTVGPVLALALVTILGAPSFGSNKAMYINCTAATNSVCRETSCQYGDYCAAIGLVAFGFKSGRQWDAFQIIMSVREQSGGD